MAQNDYQTFGDSGTDGVNKLSLVNYTADNDRVYGNGYTTKVIRSQLHNKALQQTSKMSAALAQFLVNNGQDALDTDSFSTLATKLGAVYNKFGGAISAAITLTSAQSGGRFTVAAATVAYNITLPTASAGLNFEFEGTNGAYAVGLTYAGTLYLPDGTTAAAGTFSQINLGAIGNTIKVWSDGSNWFMTTLGQTIVKNGVLNNQAVNLGQFPTLYSNNADQVLHVRDEKPTATDGGDSVAGNQVRVLNTVVRNTIVGASLATNQITLPAGKYSIVASAPNHLGDRHRIRLVNVTDSTVILAGTSEFASNASNGTTDSLLTGIFTLTATKALNITHYVLTAQSGNGLGVYTNDTFVSVYTSVYITKIG